MAAIIITQNKRNTIGSIFLGDGAKGIPIKLAYLGNKLIFNGEQWLNCLISLDNVYLLSKDNFKIQPKMEA